LGSGLRRQSLELGRSAAIDASQNTGIEADEKFRICTVESY
jgi:hypothetical protein